MFQTPLRSFFYSSAIACTLIITGSITLAGAETITVNGAGSTFVYPILSRWAQLYKDKTGNSINYQSIGSGAGIRQIKQKTVEFSASDKPLQSEELRKAGLTQFPIIIGGIVPVVHLDGINPGELRLTGSVLADIFLGKIQRWNEHPIAELNPKLKLPDTLIAPVHRADGSGSTFLFTHYLSQISPEWKKNIGSDSSVYWKTGIGGKGNEGVSAYIQRIKGAIGYVEYAYAKRSNLSYITLQNADGVYVKPNNTTFAAAASYADWGKIPDFYGILTNEPGKNSWPITGATFAIMYKQPTNAQKSETVLNFFDWAFKNGQSEATQLDYVALPAPLVKRIEDSWKKNILLNTSTHSK